MRNESAWGPHVHICSTGELFVYHCDYSCCRNKRGCALTPTVPELIFTHRGQACYRSPGVRYSPVCGNLYAHTVLSGAQIRITTFEVECVPLSKALAPLNANRNDVLFSRRVALLLCPLGERSGWSCGFRKQHLHASWILGHHFASGY